MRILLFSNIPDSHSSGMGNWTHSVAAAIRAKGHEVEVWFEDALRSSRRMGRARVVVDPWRLAARLSRERARFDVVVLHEPSAFWYGLQRKLDARLPPLVLMCHNVESKVFRQMRRAAGVGLAQVPLGSRVKTPLFRLWQSDGAIRMADQVLCLSSEDVQYVRDDLGVQAERIWRMTNGGAVEAVDERAFVRVPNSVLVVGGWLDVKGRRLLPRLWEVVSRRVPEARLTLVGTGTADTEVLASFERTARGRISVVPRVETAVEMRAIYRQHEIFLMPSLSEGSPLSLVEAMQAETCIVASSVGGIPDIVETERTALLFPVTAPEEGAEMVIRALADQELRVRLREAARRRGRELTWEAAADVLLDASKSAAAVGQVVRTAGLR